MSYLLFADDNEDMRFMLRDLFRSSGHEVCLAEDGLAALASIREREPDLVVLDHSMPGMSGFEVCRNMKRNPFTARIPVLMLTAQSEIESKIEGFAAGADDYLAKPFDPRELRARVSALLRLVEREGDRNPTSGLPGGHAIEKEIAQRVAKGDTFAVCYLDLDNFKGVNDRYGHEAGNVVLRETAKRCGAHIRLTDLAGRYGGDEFVVVLVGTGEEGAVVVAEKIRAAVEDVGKQMGYPAGIVTASIGVAEYRAGEHKDEDVLVAADRALYRAKAAGRNRVATGGDL